MMLRRRWLGWTLFAATALAAACGGSSQDGGENPGSAGSAGSAAAGTSAGTNAGTSSSGGRGGGGTSSAGTSAGGRNTGGRNTGGAAGSGGFGIGGFNLGGEGFDPSDFACESPPEEGAACDAEAVPCLNGTSICYCEASQWACTSVLGVGGTGPVGDIECPDTKPSSGDPCGDSTGFCPFEGGQFGGCACYQGSWACL